MPTDCIKLCPWTGRLRTVVQCHQCQPEEKCRVRCVACNYLNHCPRHGAQPIVCLQAMDKHDKMGLLYGLLKPTSADPWQTDPVQKVTWNGRMLIHDIGSHFGTYHDTDSGPDTEYKTHGGFIKAFKYSDVMLLCPNLQSPPLHIPVKSNVQALLEQCMTHMNLSLVSKLILQLMTTPWH